MDSAKKNWPKRPLLDFTYQEDESIIIKVGTQQNHAEFKISKLRLDYYSPYFRVCLASELKEGLSKVVELEDVSPEIFRHIIQYMNTETILIPGPPDSSYLQALATQDIPGFDVILDMPDWRGTTTTRSYPDESLDLGKLARIWVLADYLMIPHVQNVATHLMYRRLLVRGTPDCHFGELVDAIGVALGMDGTMARKIMNYDEWTPQQRAMIPRAIMDGAMAAVRKFSRKQILRGPAYKNHMIAKKMKYVGRFFVEDKIDGGDADSGLDPYYHYLDDCIRP
ncbi:hypothetical protein DSL72_003547 [Monilinia vaccinii-corymbosi]|uniref:BTB domain-containing protein n=1 Tax=Monilinia vaccinii-corymbosi TaxID=61207 RepID=A0A8A3P941_9HELO|nr:hypothetical protein DSL72_003547 [Monilinia vaccinii-corymbosi]